MRPSGYQWWLPPRWQYTEKRLSKWRTGRYRIKVLEFVDRWSRDQKSCSSWVMLSVSSASTTVIEPSKGANDWECVDKNLQKLNFGVVFAEVNECCSTKQSFYACIRQHLLDEETNICSYVSCAFSDIWSTREVWHLSCSPNFPRASYLDERTLTYVPIVNS